MKHVSCAADGVPGYAYLAVKYVNRGGGGGGGSQAESVKQ